MYTACSACAFYDDSIDGVCPECPDDSGDGLCEAHADCGDSEYCDEAGLCYGCTECAYWQDSITGECPDCELSSGQCASQDDCDASTYCDVYHDCYGRENYLDLVSVFLDALRFFPPRMLLIFDFMCMFASTLRVCI